jgi:divalent metal cation (Fe/Co/Zn/Cd) transporter
MEARAEGMRALWISLAVLGVTALIQAAVTSVSGTIALLPPPRRTRPTR